MYKPPLKKFAMSLLSFVLGVCVGVLGNILVTKTFMATGKDEPIESARVTSPDGELDAVLVEDASGGALGGIFWYVYVVPKGKVAPRDVKRCLFFADELTKGAIVWSKPHLIEIYYDKASIMQFRNISTPSENGLQYVELRLVPTEEYSLVTPQGGWRSD
jgi:hypothetical protein